jgi:hypothetical protein
VREYVVDPPREAVDGDDDRDDRGYENEVCREIDPVYRVFLERSGGVHRLIYDKSVFLYIYSSL